MMRKPPAGEVRRSQLLTTYGPGSLVDLPKHAVMIGGLDHWSESGRIPIHEERLLAKLRPLFPDAHDLQLFSPPIDDGLGGNEWQGIVAWEFPEWFVAQHEAASRAEVIRSRPLLHRQQLDKGKYRVVDDTGKSHRKAVLPIRFVQACANGHIADISWREWVHAPTLPGALRCPRLLWIDESGTSGDFADIFIRCECGKSKSLAQARDGGTLGPPLGMCEGKKPWLGPRSSEACDQPNRLLVRHASHAYFAQTLRVIHIPDPNAPLRRAVDAVWTDFLETCIDLKDVQHERTKKKKVASALEGYDDDAVFAEVQRRHGHAPEEEKTVKQVEIATLLAQEHQHIADDNGSDFSASALAIVPGRKELTSRIEKVVLVHRLREVTAQIGFTRFEGAAADEEGELDLSVKLAHLAENVSWLPAVENQGEGFFLAFKRDAVEAWLKRSGVKARTKELASARGKWLLEKNRAEKRPYSPAYTMLHSLSHLLLTAVALDCGYPSSAIRERVYANDEGYGILLFTGTPDAEGTLGGLIDVGRHIDRHLEAALELARLCSNDPVCAHHSPTNEAERRFLHGAACHGCVLISEVSCEMRNEHLDRALVVPTVACDDASFFE